MILFASTALSVEAPEIMLCNGVPVGSTLVVELEGQFITLWDAASSVLIHNTKRVLRCVVALKSGLLKPLHCALGILFASIAFKV